MNLKLEKQWSLYGHHVTFLNFIDLYNKNKLPNKILLSGEKGIGKSTLAYHIINQILSSDEDFSYDFVNFRINSDNRSFKLVTNKSNPNFISIDVNEDKKFQIVEDFVLKSDFEDGEKITIDGLRVNFDDGWGLLRASNTTPKLVLRFEADSLKRLNEIQNIFLNQLKRIDESINIELS